MFHHVVGGIRCLGVVLYDADRIEEVSNLPQEELIEGQRSLLLDPHGPHVVEAALKNGIAESTLKAAQNSPVYQFVKVWKMALPPHIEYRTLPMLFYVPPMAPVIAARKDGGLDSISDNLFHDIEDARVPMKFLENMFGAGQEGKVAYALRKQKSVRWYRRAVTVGDVTLETAERMLKEADCTIQEAQAIYELTSLCTFEQRFVIPPAHREEAIEAMKDPQEHKQGAGFGFLSGPRRGL